MKYKNFIFERRKTMEIIKPGDLEKAKKKKLHPLKFTCPDCECIFVADNTEYE